MTSLAYDGNFGGIANTNAACNTRAASSAAGLGGSWTAWVSDVDGNAIDRIFRANVPYQLVNGTKIADDVVDLTNGSLDARINVDETGATVPAGVGSQVWTATDADGTSAGLDTCDSWTSNSNTDRAQIGDADSKTASWTDAGGGLSATYPAGSTASPTLSATRKNNVPVGTTARDPVGGGRGSKGVWRPENGPSVPLGSTKDVFGTSEK